MTVIIDGSEFKPAPPTYREWRSVKGKAWIELVDVTAAEWAEAFGTAFQTLNKIYTPLLQVGTHTLILVSSKGFTGKTTTIWEVEITTAGAPDGTAKFKYRKQTFSNDWAWGDYTEDQTCGGDVDVGDGVHLNFNDGVYAVGDKWAVQAAGTWHTPKDGKTSYLTSVTIGTYSTAPITIKPAHIHFYRDYHHFNSVVSTEHVRDLYPTPLKLVGNGTIQWKAEFAEFTEKDIDSAYALIKGWDE